MTTSTYDTPAMTGSDSTTLAVEGIARTARRMQIPEAQVASSLALSVWTTPEEMIKREFAGAYRGCYPNCSMELRAQAVIAEVFDQPAIALGDPRRALRAVGYGRRPAAGSEGAPMGEGLYWSRDGRTAYAERYDDLDLADPDLWGMAYDDLVSTIRALLSNA